jgi:BlaI family transcriptional regulator, penicillinase repressor
LKRRRSRQLTPVELEIMNVLWETGPANVQAVRDRLPGLSQPAYTTVQTILNILWRKGRAKRVLVGKAYEYSPAVSKQKAIRQIVHDLLENMFGGSAESLVMSLIENRQLNPEKLTELRRLVERSKASQGEEHGVE